MVRAPVIRTALVAGLLATAGLIVSASPVAAYGRADAPLAQIEFSGNCNNPGFFLCASPPAGFGLGGIWFWIEVDANGTGDIAGAGCGHDRAGTGGGGSIKGEVSWFYSPVPIGPTFFTDPNGLYYVVDFGDGPFSFPTTVGHYSFHPAPGVALESQTAP